MIIQPTNLLTLLNSVFTTFTEGSVKYKTKPDPILTNNFQRFFELSLPQVINKADVEHILITVCKKATLSTGEYFKHLDFQTEHIILSPCFENDCLKIWIGNTDVENENELTAAYISKIKEEFKKKDKEVFRKILSTEKSKLTNNFDTSYAYYEPDKDLEIYSYFETNYITNDLAALRVEKNVEDLFRKIIDSLFTERLMREKVLKCARLYLMTHINLKNNDLTFTKDVKIKTVPFDTWLDVFVEKFSESLTADHLESIKEYLKNMTTVCFIDDLIAEPLVKTFISELESHYYAKAGSLKIGGLNFNVVNIKLDIKDILNFLKAQYFYFYNEVLFEVHHMAQATKQAVKAITDFNETNIEMFKRLLTTYQKAFDDEAENSFSHLIEPLKIKLNEAVEKNDIKTKKVQLDLFDASKDEKKVLQFTLFLKESKYVYPKFYTFTNDALIPIEDEAEVEAYKIIIEAITKGPQDSREPKRATVLGEGFFGDEN